MNAQLSEHAAKLMALVEADPRSNQEICRLAGYHVSFLAVVKNGKMNFNSMYTYACFLNVLGYDLEIVPRE